MTYIQIFTGGQPISPDAIRSAGVHELYAAEIDDWQTPPTPPALTSHIKAADLPPTIRHILAKALCKAMEQATGFTIDIKA